jgi:gliding motility-associated-like protein
LKKHHLFTCICLLYCIVCYGQRPTANFTASPTSGCSPLIVNFTDLSTGNPTAWLWDFGNGATSTLKNPSTTYFNPGSYTVRLTVTNAAGNHTLTRTTLITLYDRPTVGFTVNNKAGCFPVYAQFTDTSKASPGTTNTSWFWDFGDGTQSTQQNPLHIYTTSGSFAVTLRVTNSQGCFSTISRPAYINVNPGVRSSFTNTTPTICKPPFNISFTNTSTGPGTLTHQWNFGDGTTSTETSPSHVYTSPGNYSVTLITTSSEGCSDTLRKVNLLNLLNINSAFTTVDSVCINAPITLQNQSSPAPVSQIWDFGDGTTSTAANPVKIWTVPGTYTIRLINQFSYCADSVTKTIVVSPRPIAGFTTSDTIKCQPPFAVNFQNQSQNGVRWLWDFGDGNTSTAANPTHTYNNFGIYNVRLITTNSYGCTDTIQKNNLIKIVKPVISFSSLPQWGCVPYDANFSADITTLDNVTSYLWNFGDGNTSTLPTPNHIYTIQGSYNVTLTITTSTGCTETFTLQNAIMVGRRPIIDFNAVPNPVCAFQDVQFTNLTNEGDTFIWRFGDGITSNIQNPVHQYTDTGRFNVTLIVNNNGCIDSLTKNNFIRIKPPIAKFDFLPDCNNRLRFSFRDSSIGATSWLWNFGDGQTSTLQNPVHTFPSFGTYTVRLTVNNDTCSHSITKNILVFDENPNFAANQTIACRTGIINFNVTNVNFSNIVKYEWDFGNGTTNSTSTPSVTANYPLSGTYTVRLVTTDIYGCTDVVVKTNYIRINGPTANFTADNTSGCKGLVTTFNDLSTYDGIRPIVNWRWDFGDGTIRNMSSGPFSHTYNTPGNFSVKLIVTDAGGCRDSVIAWNIINASDPKANFQSADTLACPGSSVHFQNTSTGYDFTSRWNFGDELTSITDNPTHSYPEPGEYTISLSITDFYGCSDSITKPAYIKVDRPVASFDVSDSISSCIPFEVNFTNTSHYHNSSVWNLGVGSSTQASPTVYYVTPGTYQTSIAVTSPGGCTDTAYRTLILYDTIGTYLRYAPFDGCKPLTVNLEAYSKGPMKFTWDMGDGVVTNTDTAGLSHVYNFFGNFIPRVIMTDPSGCVIPVEGTDTIRIIGATAKFGLDNNFFCDSGWVQFIDSTTFNDPLTSYTWNFGDGNTSNSTAPRHFYSSPGIYTVSLTVNTTSACMDTFRLRDVIKIVESPLISVAGDSIICVNEFMTHMGVFERQDTSVVKWQWQFPNGNQSIIQNPLRQRYGTAGNFMVSAIATNSSGCRDTATKNILVNPLPMVTMPPTITKQAGFPVTLPATFSPNVSNYLWIPNATLSCDDCPQPVATPKFNTHYTVSFIDSNGCKNTGHIEVIVYCENANVFIPNTFSPNGDGNNDVFYVRGKGLERVKALRIFNRWGEVVFEKNNFAVNDASVGWDGRHKGNRPVPDVYVYQVEVFCENSDVIRYEGNVALIQ